MEDKVMLQSSGDTTTAGDYGDDATLAFAERLRAAASALPPPSSFHSEVERDAVPGAEELVRDILKSKCHTYQRKNSNVRQIIALLALLDAQVCRLNKFAEISSSSCSSSSKYSSSSSSSSNSNSNSGSGSSSSSNSNVNSGSGSGSSSSITRLPLSLCFLELGAGKALLARTLYEYYNRKYRVLALDNRRPSDRKARLATNYDAESAADYKLIEQRKSDQVAAKEGEEKKEKKEMEDQEEKGQKGEGMEMEKETKVNSNNTLPLVPTAEKKGGSAVASGVKKSNSSCDDGAMTEYYARLIRDISDLDCRTDPTLEGVATIGVAKHLCGTATDIALRALCANVRSSDVVGGDEIEAAGAETVTTASATAAATARATTTTTKTMSSCSIVVEPAAMTGRVHGLCMAPCCHQKAKFRDYCGASYLEAIGFGGGRNFATLRSLVQLSRHDKLGAHEYRKWSVLRVMSWPEVRQLGRCARRLLEEGRLEYLRSHGFKNVHLVTYVDEGTTPDNWAIMGDHVGSYSSS